MYTIMAVVNLSNLSKDSFANSPDEIWSVEDLFSYVYSLERMRIIHGVSLILMTICVAFLTTRNKVTTKQRYTNLVILTLTLELSFLVPLVYGSIKALALRGKAGTDLFSSWALDLVKSTNVNTFGIFWNLLVVLAIFSVSITIQVLTIWLRSSIRELETLRDKVHFDLIMDQTAYEEFDDEEEEDDIELQESKVAKN